MSTNPILFAECTAELERLRAEAMQILGRRLRPGGLDDADWGRLGKLRTRREVLMKTFAAIELHDMATAMAFAERTGQPLGDHCPTSEDLQRAAEICAEHELGTE